MSSSRRVSSLFAGLVRGVVLASLASAAVAATSSGALAERLDAAKSADASTAAQATSSAPQARSGSAIVTVTVKPLKLSDVKADAVADWEAAR